MAASVILLHSLRTVSVGSLSEVCLLTSLKRFGVELTLQWTELPNRSAYVLQEQLDVFFNTYKTTETMRSEN